MAYLGHSTSCSTIAVFLSFNFSDVNECDDNPNYCQVGGQCVNTPGSYRCLCKDGYEVGNGGSHCIGKRHFLSYFIAIHSQLNHNYSGKSEEESLITQGQVLFVVTTKFIHDFNF